LEVGGKLIYIDYPYTLQNEKPITEEQVERLILRMDFQRCDLEFTDGPSAVAFLKAKANEGPDPFANETEESILEGFNSLGAKNLSGIVDSIRKNYIHRHQYHQAITGLERIRGLQVVAEDPELRLKVLELLNVCRREVMEAFAFKATAMERTKAAELLSDLDQFPSLKATSPPNSEDWIGNNWNNLAG
jgi:hypothetical protein